ncbi:hypothetical protein [Gordonia amicalis]|uniref:hypothetical protein n=1 Tax=Gordonia amicalis TaxID=89053 RepID=UPI0024B99A3A|nr:hypothetical protein [Gordonia amicalis]MDJ0454404.1 hypothetical protein [Gordonia amicalis]MDV7077707.1 hypothetical protein [Gordonia amicalis]
MSKKSVVVPASLGAAGERLFREIAEKWDLRPDEQRVLLDACAEADLVDDLAAAMQDQPRLVKGSQGQSVINPLISEQRQHRMALASLLKQLRLPDEADSAEARSTKARAAANARWSKRAG